MLVHQRVSTIFHAFKCPNLGMATQPFFPPHGIPVATDNWSVLTWTSGFSGLRWLSLGLMENLQENHIFDGANHGFLQILQPIPAKVYIPKYIYIYIYVCIYRDTHTHIYIYTHLYIYIHTYIYIYTPNHTYIYIYVCVCVKVVINN